MYMFSFRMEPLHKPQDFRETSQAVSLTAEEMGFLKGNNLLLLQKYKECIA